MSDLFLSDGAGIITFSLARTVLRVEDRRVVRGIVYVIHNGLR